MNDYFHDDTVIIEKFIESIREYMEQNDMTVTDFARKIGCLERCVARWLNGTNIPSTEYVMKTADGLNCSADYLFQRTDKPEYVPAKVRVQFCERLRELIAKSGKTKYAWAKEWNTEPSAVTTWLKGQRLPKPDKVFVMAESFGCSMDFLLGRTDC